MEFMEGNIIQVAETAIDDNHVYELREVSSRNASQTTTIDTHLAFHAELILAEPEHSLAILPKVLGGGRAAAHGTL